MGINVSRVKIENLHVNNYNDSDSSDSEDETQNDFSELIDNSTNVGQLIDIYYKHYETEYYLKYPEFATNKLSLDKKHLENLQNLMKEQEKMSNNGLLNLKLLLNKLFLQDGNLVLQLNKILH